MGHLENKLEWCIKKAKKEGEKHRGLKKTKPDMERAKEHIAKANHNLRAMLYFIKGNFTDWSVNACFYSMYHCLLAILAKHGYESRNQECTFAAVEYLIKNKKVNLDINWLRKISSFDKKQTEEEIIQLREEFQYGTETILNQKKVKKLMEDAKEFIEVVREVLKE